MWIFLCSVFVESRSQKSCVYFKTCSLQDCASLPFTSCFESLHIEVLTLLLLHFIYKVAYDHKDLSTPYGLGLVAWRNLICSPELHFLLSNYNFCQTWTVIPDLTILHKQSRYQIWCSRNCWHWFSLLRIILILMWRYLVPLWYIYSTIVE